jgi:hypothetical protein
MKKHLLLLAVVLWLAFVCVSQAQATLTTFDITFSADFNGSFVGRISGEFLATFDPAAAIDTSGTAVPILPWTNFSPGDVGPPYARSIFHYYNRVDSAIDTLVAYFEQTSPEALFFIQIHGFADPAVRFVAAVYSHPLADPYNDGTLTGTAFATIPSTVPLPGAVILLGAGLGRLALYSRRKLTAKN